MTAPGEGRSALLPALALLGVTATWGLTFVMVKDAVALYPPVTFLAARFLLAAVVLGAFAVRRPADARLGLLIGALLAAGYLTQTYGLLTVPASTAGLLTGMFVVFTPLCDAVIFRVRTPRITIVAVAIALLGMAAVTYGGNPGRGELFGEALLLLCALAFAAHIAFLSHYSHRHSALGLAGWQMVACALAFTLGSLGARSVSAPPPAVFPALLVTGLGASAAGFLVQTYVQRRLSAGRAALLLTAEPAFAVLFGVLLAHDNLSPLRILGAAVILLALAGHETILARRRPEGAPEG
ncbi:MAG: DMT family transporter [Candidatus Dormibacteria bacterium]